MQDKIQTLLKGRQVLPKESVPNTKSSSPMRLECSFARNASALSRPESILGSELADLP